MSASFFEFFLKTFGVSFGETFLNYAGSAVNEFLSFLKSETCLSFNNFNNVKFVGTSVFEDNVKRGFLFSGGSTGSGTGSNCYSGSSGFDTIFLFENLSKFVYFFY